MTRSKTPVIVIGAGGHAKVVIATLQAAGFQVAAALDDEKSRWGLELLGVSVTGPVSDEAVRGRSAIIALGDNLVRRQLADKLAGADWISVVHPSATVHPTVRLGEGTIVMAGAVIQPDADVGTHSIINTAATVDHDCLVGSFAHLAPGVHLAGEVRIADGVFLGIGTVVIPRKSVGEWTVVGAGSVVINDLPARVKAVGAPAKAMEGRPV
jgi:sugar O-acyltransferase (sialic acid O-acetyltransferase NeuD family)